MKSEQDDSQELSESFVYMDIGNDKKRKMGSDEVAHSFPPQPVYYIWRSLYELVIASINTHQSILS